MWFTAPECRVAESRTFREVLVSERAKLLEEGSAMAYGGDPMGAGKVDEGQVTLCTARDCMYNEATRCVARGVMVNLHQDHADCNTYSRNQHIPGSTPGTAQL